MTKDNFIFGVHPVQEALEAGKEIDKIFMQKTWQRKPPRKSFRPVAGSMCLCCGCQKKS
ncbi:MAG: hypothetical protein HC842_02150 [Cytophagales bacterium]|nr:hypothetical protein [Cytophagales bacterium]